MNAEGAAFGSDLLRDPAALLDALIDGVLANDQGDAHPSTAGETTPRPLF